MAWADPQASRPATDQQAAGQLRAAAPATTGQATVLAAPLTELRRLGTSPRGLTEAAAQARLQQHGENVIVTAAPPRIALLARAACSPFVLLLIVIAAITAVTGNAVSAALIAALAVVSCVIRASQERRSWLACTLRPALPGTATVVRRPADGLRPALREVPADQLVPGDVVRLAAGDTVPADLMLLRAEHLMVSQAVLTGESLPVAKSATVTGPAGRLAPDTSQACLQGSVVTAGSGTGVVIATGARSYLGSAGRGPARTGQTSFDRGVRDISVLLICLVLVAVLAVSAVGAGPHRDLDDALLLAVAVAVGVVPEMLPVVVTATLARAARRTARIAAVVRRQPAMHNIGAVQVLCIDKTGTLTSDSLAVARAVDPRGNADQGVLRWARLNSAHSVLAGDQPADGLDAALLDQQHPGSCQPQYLLVDLLPFDHARRRATVVLRNAAAPGRHTLVCKGAPAEVLACCSHWLAGGSTVRLTAALRQQAARLADGLAASGLRTLAVAISSRDAKLGRYRAADEAGLTLIGFVGFADPPDPSASQALAGLAARGVQVKLITGDHALVAARVCAAAGLDPGLPVTGDQIAGLTDDELARLAAGTTVFARIRPADKARIVSALRRDGTAVGFLGDGVNDTHALLAADAGIAVAGCEPAVRECADVLLLRKDLGAVGQAISEGRAAFGNITNYLRITVSANLGNMLSMVIASAMLPFLPMLPAQVLVQNLCFDVCQLTLAYDRAAASDRPRTFSTAELARFAIVLGVVNAAADLVTFAILRHLIGPHPDPAVFRAGWFTENMLSQAAAIHLLRRGTLQRRGGLHRGLPVLLGTAGLAAAGLLLPLSPVGGLLGMRAYPVAFLPLLGCTLAGFCLATLAALALARRPRRPRRQPVSLT